jgi:hypothetical protein
VTRHLHLVRDLDESEATPVPPTAPTTYQERRALYLSVPCPMPRCGKPPGWACTTPNGWATLHKARIRAALGQTPAAPKPRKHRLTEAQAQRVEWAAEHGRIYAADQYATLGGDAAERACADALLRHGLVTQVDTTRSGERVLKLTADGWRAYHHDPKVIRRVPDDQHPGICPCRTAQEER